MAIWVLILLLVIVGVSLAAAAGVTALIFWLVKKGQQPDKSAIK